MKGLINNTEPQIGSRMKVGDILMGPIGTIQKVQRLEKRDNKIYAMPQNIEWNTKVMPDKEGCELVMSAFEIKEPPTQFLCWLKFDELNMEETLNKIYSQVSEKEAIKEIYTLGNVGPNIKWWDQFCKQIDFTKLNLFSPMYSLLVTLKPYRREITGYNQMIDRMVEAIKQQGKDNEASLIESFVKWKIETAPKEITLDETDHLASFDYYAGLSYAKKRNLKQSTYLQDVRKGTHFVVSCGDVIVKVSETDFPEVERRELN
jgi:hypothetical protein